MNTARLNLEAGLKNLGDVAKVLDVITESHRHRSQLPAKVVAL